MSKKKETFSFPYLFLVMNLALIVGIYFIITNSVERSLTSAITTSTEASNAAVTRLFINEIYPDLAVDIGLTNDPTKVKSSLSEDEIKYVDNRVREFMFGTDILKAKIYNINGVTLYSSDFSQIGDNKSGNAGFDSAIKGIAASQVTHRGQFSALDGEVFKRDLVASYIPIYNEARDIIGVAELYTDRSGVIEYAKQLSNELKIELLPLLAVIMLAVSLVIWRFQAIVTRLQVKLISQKSEGP